MDGYITWSDEMTLEAMKLRLAGKTNRDVAAIMGVSFNSVKARFHRLCHAKAGLNGGTVWDGTPESLGRYLKWSEACEKSPWRNPAWTKAEQRRLTKLFEQGFSAARIAERLKCRSENAVKTQIGKLGLKREPITDEGMPWFAPGRPAESATYAGCLISAAGDCREATRAHVARVAAFAAMFSKLRKARAA